jgi:alcohol dehydrogenase
MFDMKAFNYSMPVEILSGKNIICDKYEIFGKHGKRAMIITGGSSSKKNGSLSDVEFALKKSKIDYFIFDEVEENPSIETVEKARKLAQRFDVDFIVGIGGGSPIDAGKAVAILLANLDMDAKDIFDTPNLNSIPLIAVPTTAGTGTEVTQYAILTDHRAKTKRNFNQSVFPKVAFLDASYLMTTPDEVTINTSIDALSHLIEGYLSSKSNFMSDIFAREGLRLFSEVKDSIKKRAFDFDVREKLLWISTLAGIVIAQSGTSLPHGMGYALTYNKGLKHGMANGILLAEYLNCSKSLYKVEDIINLMRFASIENFGIYLKSLFGDINLEIDESELRDYANSMMENKGKLKNHPLDINFDQMYDIYFQSLKKYIIK